MSHDTICTSLALSGFFVLIVEDEYYIAQDLSTSLGRAGARIVGPCATVDAAEAAARDEARIDLAILDLMLREEPVWPVADLLARRGVPFLFATGYDDDLLPEKYRDRPVIEKPYEPAQLVEQLLRLRL